MTAQELYYHIRQIDLYPELIMIELEEWLDAQYFTARSEVQ